MQTRALGNALSSAGLLAIAALVYWPSSVALWNWWTNDNHGGVHGLLVVPLAAALLYRARHRLNAIPAQPSGVACVLLLLCSLAWLVFWRAGIQELHLLLLPVLMGLAICTVLGFRAVPIIYFPLGFLYFAVPAWGIFIEPLQQLTVAVVGFLAPFVGVQAHIQGDLVVMPGVGIIEIAGSCSGANFFCIGLAVGALLGELESATLLRRVALLAAMGVMAAVSNWVRVLIIVEAGYSTHMRHVLVSRGHYTFGWVLFATVMVVCVWLLARPPPGSEHAEGEPRAAAMVARLSAYALAMVALVVAPLAVYTVVGTIDSAAAPVAFAAPLGRNGWVGPVGAGAWQPDFVGPHSQWSVAYTGPAGHNVDMVAIGYSSQAQGQELVNEENSLFAASTFTPTAEDKVTLGPDSYIETIATDAQGRRSLVWSVYDIGGRKFVTPFLSQLWYGVRSLGGSPISVLFAVRTTCESSCDAARATLRSFVQTMGPDLFASITRTPRSSHGADRV
jgi:EpsI family protein